MEFRVGTCTSCNKKFKVPATFQSDKAKCKHCGGVVEIAAAAAGAKPAAKPAAKPVPVPAKKAAAPRPARAGVRAAGAAGVAKAAASDSVRGKARAAGQRVKAAGTKAAAPAEKPGAKPGAGARAGARTGSGRASSGSSSRRSRARPAPKKSPVGMIVGIVVLVLGLGAGAFFMMKDGGDNATQAAETNVAQANANPLNEAGAGEANPTPENPTPEAPEAMDPEQPVEPDPDPEPSAPAKPAEVVLLDLLEELPDLEPLPGTDPERAAELRQLMAEYIDPNAGAAGSRAGKALEEASKEAFPFIINAFKRIDTTNEDGFRAGDLTQKLLERICNGTNYGWNYPAPGEETLAPKDVLFNQKIVRAWHNIWLEAKDDEAKWLVLTKQAAKPEETKKVELDDF